MTEFESHFMLNYTNSVFKKYELWDLPQINETQIPRNGAQGSEL